MTRSKDSSTEPTTSAPHGRYLKLPKSDGPNTSAELANVGGWMTFTPESVDGISELLTTSLHRAQSEIASAIESFISTELIPYCRKLSPGDLNLLSQRYVLGAAFNSESTYHGSNFCFKFTIRLYSKSQTTELEKPALLISLENISELLSHTLTHSPSHGESQPLTTLGENANKGS